ncbi:Pre-mRNA splicing factor [Phytophthora cactorum]|nr:Pre-mRNA splicing factor [Phytophthora cactorum]
MSLAFLSKKSWHTANLRVQAAAEEKKVAELRKNIEEERQLQELRQLQAARGDKSAAVERLDWMYEGPSAAREKTAEEYLLGKEYKGEDEKAAKVDVDLSTTTKYGSLALTKSALPANDAFQRLNEDPMMLIRKRQQAAREQVLKNPVKMKRIKDEVSRLKEDKMARKKAKKAAKKEKKHARKEEKRRLKRKHDYDSVSDASADENEEKAGHRHKDYPSKHHRGHGRDRENGRSRSRSESRSRSPLSARHRGGSRPHHSYREPVRRESSPAKSRSSRNRYADERRGRSSSRDRRSSAPLETVATVVEATVPVDTSDETGTVAVVPKDVMTSVAIDLQPDPTRARDPVEVRDDSRRHKEPESRRKPLDADGKYGLISKAGAVESKDVDKSSLGPNAKYLAKAREVKRLEEEERQRKLGKSSRREHRELTDEENVRMAQQMLEDAKQRDEYIAKRATVKNDELDKLEQEASKSNPEFLRKLHSEAYLDGESNMSDRLRRNAHYIQRKADASNFLSK